MLDESGVKTMPGSISAPNSGSLWKIRQIQVAKRGTPKKYFLKEVFCCFSVLRVLFYNFLSKES